jgi:hypothetical protein
VRFRHCRFNSKQLALGFNKTGQHRYFVFLTTLRI